VVVGDGQPPRPWLAGNDRLLPFHYGYKILPIISPSGCAFLKQPRAVCCGCWRAIPGLYGISRPKRSARHRSRASDFAPPLGLEAHIAPETLGDLFLDSLPYNAHTTASDALWRGLPLLTCRGTAFAGRVATTCSMPLAFPNSDGNLADYESTPCSWCTMPRF